ncbi:MAG: RNA polymerase sigma-54 factor, partial [Sphingomonas sp.]|nr:RNA polymerase sigma-54 factor [Sphingomonas sp.]
MALGPRLDLRQSQSLVMTPQLQLAIRLLALSNLEVEGFIAEEIERNPLLEAGPPDDDGPTQEREVSAELPSEPASADELIMGGDHAGEAALDVDFSAETFHHDSVADGAGMDGSLGMNAASGAGSASEDGPDFDSFAAVDISLADHLLAQAGPVMSGADAFIAAHLIDQIDECGYLTVPLLDIANRLGVPLARVEAVLATI